MTAADVGLDGTPVLVMRGSLTIGDLVLECGVLSDGRRIFFGKGIEQFIGILSDIPQPKATPNDPP